MAQRWIRRRAHTRRTEAGDEIRVTAHWALIGAGTPEPGRQPFSSTCPACGAHVTSIPMPNGGWIHIEPSVIHARVKHPCLSLGDDIADRRDGATEDLFAHIESIQEPKAI